MVKKNVAVKHNKQTTTLSSKLGEIERLFLFGNFFAARRQSMRLLASDQASESEHAFLTHIMQMTWPDKFALLAGLACLASTVAVSFLVAY